MNIIRFLKIISDKFLYVLIIPIVVGGIVFFLTKDLPVKYATFSTIYSGVTSNSGLAVDIIKVDNVATQNEYNNLMTILKSNSLFEDISLHLLTQHLIQTKPVKEIISEAAFNDLKKNVPAEVKKLVVKGNFEKTYSNLKKYIKQDEKNYIYRTMNYGHKYYSIQAISNLKGERLTNSDLIKISYESEDAGICFNTVKFATEIFVERYSELKISQSNSAIAYFERKLKEAADKLNASEQELLDFNIDNDIINYYEQTEQVTTQQEKIEVRLQEVKMEYEASQAVLSKLEIEVEKRFNINLRNSEVLRIRQQLVESNNAITAIEIGENTTNKAKLNELRIKRSAIETKLENKIDSLNIFENKSQGIESQKMLSEWLDAVKNNENYAALFKSMKIRQVDFMKQFKRYAPLGATIKRIEREIDVFEREYLSILRDLGMAQQNQQNIDMRSNMKVFDDTQFPINAIPSKKKLYVIAAALFSLIFYLLAVFIIELMDSRIKTPSLLSKLTGFETTAAFSIANNKKYKFSEFITQKASLLIFEKIKLLSKDNVKPITIQVVSSWDNTGKSYVADQIANELTIRNLSVTIVTFEKSEDQQAENVSESDKTKKLNLSSKLLKFDSYAELFVDEKITTDYVVVVIPAISNGIENSVIVNTAQANFYVFDANSSWIDADNYMLEKLNKLINTNVFAVLTRAIPDNLEEMYGEIPKKRSFFRVFIKKLLRRIIH